MAKWDPAWTNGTAEMRRLHSNINRQQAALHIWAGDTIQNSDVPLLGKNMVQSQNTNDHVVPTKKTFRWKDQFELANRKPLTFDPDALLHIWTAVVFLISLSNFTGDQLINCNQLVFVNFCPIVCCGRFYRNFSLLSFLFPFCNYFTSCALVNSSFGLLSDWCLMIRPLSLTNHLSRGADDCICKYITICIL